MRSEEVESILAAWPLPHHSIKPSLDSSRLWSYRKHKQGWRRFRGRGRGAKETYCPPSSSPVCVLSTSDGVVPRYSGPRPDTKLGEDWRDNALPAISLVKTPHCIFVFYENSICLNKYTHFSPVRFIPLHNAHLRIWYAPWHWIRHG